MYMETYVSVYKDDLQTNFRPDTRQNITKQNRTEAKTDNKKQSARNASGTSGAGSGGGASGAWLVQLMMQLVVLVGGLE